MSFGISFLFMVIAIGTRTGAVVNGCPVDIQSRTPTKCEREFESLRGYQRKRDAIRYLFSLYGYRDRDSNGCGSEWMSGGHPEPHPDQA